MIKTGNWITFGPSKKAEDSEELKQVIKVLQTTIEDLSSEVWSLRGELNCLNQIISGK